MFAMIASAIGLCYYFPAIVVIYMSNPAPQEVPITMPTSLRMAIGVMVARTFYVGLISGHSSEPGK